MAGRRHHILPRFLLKGFAHERRSEQSYVWLYSRHRDPVSVNTINAAVEGDFYGSPGAADCADPAITAAESRQAQLVERLRVGPPGPINESELGFLLAHLTARTKHLRTAFAECAVQLLEALRAALHDAGTLERLLLRQLEDEAWLEAQVAQSMPDALRTPEIVQAMTPAIRAMAPVLIAQARPELAQLLGNLLEQTRGPAITAATSGQLRALLRLTAASPRAEFFQGLEWHTQTTDLPLALGDSAALFDLEGESVLRPYPEDLARVRAVYLPLSSERLLVGRTARPAPERTPAEMVQAAARCSRDFFVSAQAPEVHGHLVPSVGADAVFFSRDQIEAIVLASFREPSDERDQGSRPVS